VISSRSSLSLFGLLLVGGGVFLATRPAEDLKAFLAGELPHVAGTLGEQVGADQHLSLEQPETFVEVDTPYGAWLGVKLAYQVEFESIVDVISEGTTQSIRHAFSGRQVVKIVERTHEGAIVSYSWPEITLELIEDGIHASIEETQALTRELAQPVLVYYDLEGRQQALRFTAGVNATTRNWVRSLVASQHGPVPEDPPLDFDLIEANASGLSLVHYAVTELSKDAAVISRNKLKALDGMAWGDGVKAPEVSGEGVITLSRGWTLSVDWQERSTLELEEANLRVNKSFNAKVDRISLGQIALDALSYEGFESEWRALDGLSEAVQHPDQVPTEVDPAFISEADAQTVLSSLVTLERAHDHSANVMLAVDRLTLLITEDPENLQLLRRRITAGSLPEWTTSKVLGAVAAAGSPSAQELLRVLFSDSESPEISLNAVSLALSLLEHPTPETIDFFWGRIADEELSREARHSSWRLLGLYANTGSDPTLMTKLLSMEAKAVEAGELIPWLEALGNTRSPEAFKGVQDHLVADDLNVRVNAVKALRDIDLRVATDALINLGGTDESAIVRAEALALLSRRDRTEAIRALIDLLHDEPEVAVRRSALERLAQRPLSGELVVLLSIVTTSDPDIMLRAYALTLLGS
jgi:hypothetical protein